MLGSIECLQQMLELVQLNLGVTLSPLHTSPKQKPFFVFGSFSPCSVTQEGVQCLAAGVRQ